MVKLQQCVHTDASQIWWWNDIIMLHAHRVNPLDKCKFHCLLQSFELNYYKSVSQTPSDQLWDSSSILLLDHKWRTVALCEQLEYMYIWGVTLLPVSGQRWLHWMVTVSRSLRCQQCLFSGTNKLHLFMVFSWCDQASSSAVKLIKTSSILVKTSECELKKVFHMFKVNQYKLSNDFFFFFTHINNISYDEDI